MPCRSSMLGQEETISTYPPFHHREECEISPQQNGRETQHQAHEAMEVDHSHTCWIMDYLTHCPQYVRTQGCTSSTVVCSTGLPRGTVLAPFLFTLSPQHTSFCSVGLITEGDDRQYRGLNQDFVDWCPQSASRSTREKPRSWWGISIGVHTPR